jgi:hypothetical protein
MAGRPRPLRRKLFRLPLRITHDHRSSAALGWLDSVYVFGLTPSSSTEKSYSPQMSGISTPHRDHEQHGLADHGDPEVGRRQERLRRGGQQAEECRQHDGHHDQPGCLGQAQGARVRRAGLGGSRCARRRRHVRGAGAATSSSCSILVDAVGGRRIAVDLADDAPAPQDDDAAATAGSARPRSRTGCTTDWRAFLERSRGCRISGIATSPTSATTSRSTASSATSSPPAP